MLIIDSNARVIPDNGSIRAENPAEQAHNTFLGVENWLSSNSPIPGFMLYRGSGL